MHIPDGFLDVKTWATLSGVSAIAIAYSVKKTGKKLGEKHIPLLGVTAAFIFAAQMLNFPVAGGTSGHLMGGVLASILLGPFSGILIMTTILVVQTLVFQDGGLTALGANIFNMGIIGSFLGYYIYIGLKKIFGDNFKGMSVSAFISGFLSILLAAGFVSVELAISKTVPLKTGLIAMLGVHSLIGIGEGFITLSVLAFIKRVRSDLLELEKI